jgi:hypothetical protein
MKRTAWAALAMAAVIGIGAPARAEDTAEKKEYVFLTGLDFSYWAADAGPTIGGPGLTLGLVLVPRHLEMEFALGSMIGGHQYTIPFETAFTVPFYVTPWFAPYLKLGPTLLTNKERHETEYDFAVSMNVGIELVPVGYDWGLYVSGDYNVCTAQDVRHQGGFTVGFHYRI